MSLDQCTGNSPDHCCWYAGQVCSYLEEYTVKDRHWCCGLLRIYETWDRVLASDEYQKDVQPLYERIPQLEKLNCRDWPEGPTLDLLNDYTLYKERDICAICMNPELRTSIDG